MEGRLAVEGAESRSGSGLVGPWISNWGWVSTSSFVDMSAVTSARVASAVAVATDWIVLSCDDINST